MLQEFSRARVLEVVSGTQIAADLRHRYITDGAASVSLRSARLLIVDALVQAKRCARQGTCDDKGLAYAHVKNIAPRLSQVTHDSDAVAVNPPFLLPQCLEPSLPSTRDSIVVVVVLLIERVEILGPLIEKPCHPALSHDIVLAQLPDTQLHQEGHEPRPIGVDPAPRISCGNPRELRERE